MIGQVAMFAGARHDVQIVMPNADLAVRKAQARDHGAQFTFLCARPGSERSKSTQASLATMTSTNTPIWPHPSPLKLSRKHMGPALKKQIVIAESTAMGTAIGISEHHVAAFDKLSGRREMALRSRGDYRFGGDMNNDTAAQRRRVLSTSPYTCATSPYTCTPEYLDPGSFAAKKKGKTKNQSKGQPVVDMLQRKCNTILAQTKYDAKMKDGKEDGILKIVEMHRLPVRLCARVVGHTWHDSIFVSPPNCLANKILNPCTCIPFTLPRVALVSQSAPPPSGAGRAPSNKWCVVAVFTSSKGAHDLRGDVATICDSLEQNDAKDKIKNGLGNFRMQCHRLQQFMVDCSTPKGVAGVSDLELPTLAAQEAKAAAIFAKEGFKIVLHASIPAEFKHMFGKSAKAPAVKKEGGKASRGTKRGSAPLRAKDSPTAKIAKAAAKAAAEKAATPSTSAELLAMLKATLQREARDQGQAFDAAGVARGMVRLTAQLANKDTLAGWTEQEMVEHPETHPVAAMELFAQAAGTIPGGRAHLAKLCSKDPE